MLILTDRARDGLAIHDYLTRHGRCHVVDLHQAQAHLSKHLIIVCDVEIGNETSVKLLGAALAKHRVDDGIPVLFLTRDSSNLTAWLALSLGATELIHSGAPPARILAVAERLIDSKNKGVTLPTSTMKARALDAKSALAGCFDAVKRGKPVSIAELNKGANVVLSAIDQTKIRLWLDVVRQFDDVTYQHCLLVAGLVAASSLKLGLTPKHQHLLSQAALIHDVGKASIPQSILNKPSALSESETVKGFGRRPQHDGSCRCGAGVRKPPKEETAVRKGTGAVGTIYGDLRVTGCLRRPFERRLIERSRDSVVEGRPWRRRRDPFWAVLGANMEIGWRFPTRLLRAGEWAAAKRGGFAARWVAGYRS